MLDLNFFTNGFLYETFPDQPKTNPMPFINAWLNFRDGVRHRCDDNCVDIWILLGSNSWILLSKHWKEFGFGWSCRPTGIWFMKAQVVNGMERQWFWILFRSADHRYEQSCRVLCSNGFNLIFEPPQFFEFPFEWLLFLRSIINFEVESNGNHKHLEQMNAISHLWSNDDFIGTYVITHEISAYQTLAAWQCWLELWLKWFHFKNSLIRIWKNPCEYKACWTLFCIFF
jgi:hypothetical protein